jgi:peptidylprolyl isomerase
MASRRSSLYNCDPEPQILRLRCAPLRMTHHFLRRRDGAVMASRRSSLHNCDPEPQILRLRCAPLRMTDHFYDVERGGSGQPWALGTRECTIEGTMKLALFLLALTSTVVAQTPTPPPSTPPPATQTQTPAPAPAATPPAQPATTPAPPAPPRPAAGVVTPPPPPEKPEDHNGPAYKNPKSTLPKVAGIPHVLYSLKYIDIKVGTGPLAEPHKFYTVNYTGWFTDGTKFDSSYDHTPKEPITFPYGAQRVIIGWDTGFEGMRLGGKRRLYVPYQLAYGLTGRGPKMGPKANLIFDVELISQSDRPPAPPAGSRPTRPMPGGPGAVGPGGMSPGSSGAARPGTPATPPAPTTPPAPATPPTPTAPPASATPAPVTPPAPPKPTTPPTL